MRRQRIFVLLAVWILSGVYVGGFVNRGWVPHDEGFLAQSAERVLSGEVPHRDYVEIYTGGLTYLHALAFVLFGVKLSSFRFVLFLVFLTFVPAVYAVAARMLSPVLAGLLTLLAVAWSVPNYFASLPSWYNLFLATFGVLALLWHVETEGTVWLFVAGLCAGLSILFKVVGLFDVAAVILFLVYREQLQASAGGEGRSNRSPAFFFWKTVGGAAFLAVLVALVGKRLDLMNFVHYILPEAAIVSFLVWSEWRHGKGTWATRWRGLRRLLVPFALGLIVPLALFSVPYAVRGSLAPLFHGVFLQPFEQIASAHGNAVPGAATLLPAIPYALVLAYFPVVSRWRENAFTAALALVFGLGLLFVSSPEVYRTVWYSARSLAVAAALVGCGFLAASGGLTDRKRQEIFLLVCVTALVSLVQFPFSAPIYFCYVAPLAALTIASLVSANPQAPRWVHSCVLVFYLLFALLLTNREYVFDLGIRFARYDADTPLRLPRAGLRVPAADARAYEALVSLVREKSHGHAIYAGPNCPEVYFLSALPNPTRTVLDFLEDFYNRSDALFRFLEEKQIRVFVLNRAPDVSRPLRPKFRAAVLARFQHSIEIGRFTLLWSD